jgi:hypothetical protein
MAAIATRAKIKRDLFILWYLKFIKFPGKESKSQVIQRSRIATRLSIGPGLRLNSKDEKRDVIGILKVTLK